MFHYLKSIVVIVSVLIYQSAYAGQIHDLIQSGDLEQVKTLLNENRDLLESKDSYGKTPLITAAYTHQLEIAAFLLEQGADIKATTNSGSTSLHGAAYFRNELMTQLLIDNGADIYVQNASRWYPVFGAVAGGDTATVSCFLNNGVDINFLNPNGYSMLFQAIDDENVEMVSFLLSKGIDTEIKADYGRTALFNVARESGNVELAKLFIDHGADINTKDQSGSSPISICAWRGFSDMANLLLDNGVMIENDPQMYQDAIAKGMSRLFYAMKDLGIPPPEETKTGGTILHNAAAGGSEEIVQYFIDSGFDLNARDRYVLTPLHFAADWNRLDAIDLLLKNGADINARSISGWSAYNFAMKKDHKETVEVLINSGADRSERVFPKIKKRYFGQKKPGNKPVIFAPDIVSSFEGEHGCVSFSPDGKSAAWSSAIFIDESGYSYDNLLMSSMVNGKWSSPEHTSFFIDYLSSDDVPFFSPKGDKIFFTSNRPIEEDGQRGKENIWFSKKIDNGWSEAFPVSQTVNSINMHWQISVDMSENIYFAGGLGIIKIYRSEYSNGEYLEPVPIEDFNSVIASIGTPFIAPDESYLIFSGKGMSSSNGSLGLHISYKTSDGSWSDPIYLGNDICSDSNELCPMVSPDGKYLFFISSRTGLNNVYWVKANFIKDLKPDLLK
jgi:ankyrin repeat protein